MTDAARRFRGRSGRLPGLVVGFGLVVGLAFVVACGPAPSASPPASPTPTGVPSPPTIDPTAAPSGDVRDLELDPDLLSHLPDEVDGLTVTRSDDAVAAALADPNVARDASAIAAAIVVDPDTGEFAFASTTRLRAGVMGDAFFRDWRDTFDDEACSQAGGVSGHAEAEIGGRATFIGSCAGGVRTYHVWLGNSGVLVSVSSVGDRRLGEQLVEGLRD